MGALLRVTVGLVAVVSLAACGPAPNRSAAGPASGLSPAPGSSSSTSRTGATSSTSSTGGTSTSGSTGSSGPSSDGSTSSTSSTSSSSSDGPSPLGTEPSTATSQSSTRVAAGPQATLVSRVHTQDRVVFLTIDDGLYQDPAFLALVRREHLPVTVFLTNRVTHEPKALAYFRQLQAAGAVIEDHTLSHPWLTKVDQATRKQEICGAAKRDGIDYGRRAQLLRPPYGAYDASVLETAHACGIRTVVLWNVVMPQKGALQSTHGNGRLEPGDIIIMHFLPGLTGQVQALQKLVAAQHLRFALLEHYV